VSSPLRTRPADDRVVSVRSFRIWHGLGALVVAGFLLSACGGGPPAASKPVTHHHKKSTTTTTVPVSGVALNTVLLATTHGTIARYSGPGGSQVGTVPGTWHGAVSTLPVLTHQGFWLQVGLAQRPNESTAWVRLQDVSLSTSPYRIVINLATTHLSLYKYGQLQFSVPAGIGLAPDVTPTGSFFITFLAVPPSAGYGSFVIVTSAHSDTITDWESSGDALVAIHGPLGSDKQIGTTGAQVSHGCIRLHESDLVRLRQVPSGSPINIVSF
jgi:hypothetical protein